MGRYALMGVNSCAVVYENDEDFGQLSMIPLYGHSANLANLNEPLPSAKIDQKSLEHLTESQKLELFEVLDCHNCHNCHPECFSETPGFTDVVTHSIPLKDGFKPKRLSAYRVPERLRPEPKPPDPRNVG